MRREHGFSILEMIVSMGVMLAVTGGIFAVMNPSQGTFQTQTEVSDLQQRLRVASDTLYKDLVMGGGGAYQGSMSGSLNYAFAAIVPFRSGAVGQDPPGTFKTDTITITYVPPTVAQTTLSDNPGNSLTNSSETKVNAEAGCPAGDLLCGFKEGMTLLIYDSTGHSDTFTVTQIQDNNANNVKLQHNSDKLAYEFLADCSSQPAPNPCGSTKIVQAASYSYYLKTDALNKTGQLMFYDGGIGADVPVVDNVVGLTFKYYGDPQPPQLNGNPLSNTIGPWTTYGPTPPALGTQVKDHNNNAADGWAAGENCVFKMDNGQQVPRLPVLGAGGTTTTLVELTQAMLTDGPWCPGGPNGAIGNAWDADLLRVRKVAVTIRVQSANAALRGPASALFTNGGTSKEGSKWLPDQQVTFSVSPRNLNLGR